MSRFRGRRRIKRAPVWGTEMTPLWAVGASTRQKPDTLRRNTSQKSFPVLGKGELSVTQQKHDPRKKRKRIRGPRSRSERPALQRTRSRGNGKTGAGRRRSQMPRLTKQSHPGSPRGPRTQQEHNKQPGDHTGEGMEPTRQSRGGGQGAQAGRLHAGRHRRIAE